MTKILTTESGHQVTAHEAAFNLAADLIEVAGFRVVDGSQASRSLYFRRKGRDATLRLADHDNYHPGRNSGEIIECRLTQWKGEVVNRWTDAKEGEIVEIDAVTAIAESPAEIEAMVADAIAAYDATVDEVDE